MADYTHISGSFGGWASFLWALAIGCNLKMHMHRLLACKNTSLLFLRLTLAANFACFDLSYIACLGFASLAK